MVGGEAGSVESAGLTSRLARPSDTRDLESREGFLGSVFRAAKGGRVGTACPTSIQSLEGGCGADTDL